MHHLLIASIWGEPSGQGWKQVLELAFAFVFCSLIGLEREIRQKSAGLRTHALVGLGAALFMLVSKYGFSDVLLGKTVSLDPSRVAAQIVSGIGFIGAGLIFVRRDSVRGLTTAAVVWVAAAVGAACGAGLPVLAAIVTAGHFIIVIGFVPLARRLPTTRFSETTLEIEYADGRGLLGPILGTVTGRGFAINRVTTRREREAQGRFVTADVEVQGSGDTEELLNVISEMEGVETVGSGDHHSPDE